MTRRRQLLLGTAGLAAAVWLGRGQRPGAAHAAEAAAFPISHSDAEWRRLLTPIQYDILRQAGTEAPESSPLDHEFRPGRYDCAGCAHALFSSATKFDSGTGWPSFWQPLDGAVVTISDQSFLMTRTAVSCANCGGHLGHVFEDGPKPTGLRYCMNGAALAFHPSLA